MTGKGTLEKVMKMKDDDLSDYADVTIFSLQTVRAKMAECSKLLRSLQQKTYMVTNTEHALIKLKTIQQKRTICKGRTFCFLLLSHSPSLSSKGHRFPSFYLFADRCPFSLSSSVRVSVEAKQSQLCIVMWIWPGLAENGYSA